MFRTRSFALCVALGTAGVSPTSLLLSLTHERKPPDAELKLGWLFDLGAFWHWDWESRHPCAGIRTAHARRHPMVALLLGRPLPPRVLFRVMDNVTPPIVPVWPADGANTQPRTLTHWW